MYACKVRARVSVSVRGSAALGVWVFEIGENVRMDVRRELDGTGREESRGRTNISRSLSSGRRL